MSQTDWPELHGRHFVGQRVLVTGGAGFIGSHLAEALVHLGASVVVLDDLSGGDRANLETFSSDRLEFAEGSILNQELLARCTQGCRLVFHQAALGSVLRSIEEPEKYTRVNMTGTSNVLEAARQAGVKRVMFAASSSAYGANPDLPKIETMSPRPLSPYAATKLAGEHMMSAYGASYALDTVSLRYFNIFGPRQNSNSAYAAVIAAFARCLLADQRPVIHGDGLQSRDFTFVDNAVHANLLAAACPEPIGGAVLNVACGQRISVQELARTMAKLLDRPHDPLHKAERAGDVKHSLADLGRVQRVIGYRPIADFDHGLRQTLDWYRGVLAPVS